MDSSNAKKEAKSRKTAPARLLELSHHADPSVQLAVAKHANTPVTALEYLSGHGKFTILKAVAEHPSTPSAILERLAFHKQHTVVEVVAKNSKTLRSTLERLAAHQHEAVRKALTANSAVTTAILETLSHDESEGVRYGVARKYLCPPALLEQLASDQSAWVRGGVAANSNAPLEVVRRLACDPEALVRGRTVYRLIKDQQNDLLEVLVRDANRDVRDAVAEDIGYSSHPKRVQLIAPLARDLDARIRERVARYGDLDTVTLELLLKDPDPEVRKALGYNKVQPTPAFVIEALANDLVAQVRWQAVCNGAITRATLERLAASDPAEHIRERAALELNSRQP